MAALARSDLDAACRNSGFACHLFGDLHGYVSLFARLINAVCSRNGFTFVGNKGAAFLASGRVRSDSKGDDHVTHALITRLWEAVP